MITVLKQFFIKDNMTEDERRTAYGTMCGVAGIILNILLFWGKIFAGIISGSISIVADAMNNLSDSGSSLVTLLGFKLAACKPDSEHPFGHGRMEYIAGFIVSLLILIMSFELFKQSVSRIINPQPVEFSWLVIGILLVTILVKCYMAYYNNAVGNAINSPTVKAVVVDSLSDCVSTGVVILVTIITHITGFEYLDGIAGVAVSLFIAYAGIQAAKDTLNPLLGKAPDPEFVDQIKEIMEQADSRITGIHDLIVHDYGPGRRIVSLHAEVPVNGDILELHDAIDNAEKLLETKLNCTATIHMDPIVTDDPEVNALKKAVEDIVKNISPNMSIHDFRTVPGPTHTNLVFDVVKPHNIDMSEVQITDIVQMKINEGRESRYYCVVHYDVDYNNR
ncbi:MAG: cation diffusion facilitator family transporter [Lachnospiraceae bacterium]|nr:cation diffusion facilitator family transporter [Lachnospiraceae bacterium]